MGRVDGKCTVYYSDAPRFGLALAERGKVIEAVDLIAGRFFRRYREGWELFQVVIHGQDGGGGSTGHTIQVGFWGEDG